MTPDRKPDANERVGTRSEYARRARAATVDGRHHMTPATLIRVDQSVLASLGGQPPWTQTQVDDVVQSQHAGLQSEHE